MTRGSSRFQTLASPPASDSPSKGFSPENEKFFISDSLPLLQVRVTMRLGSVSRGRTFQISIALTAFGQRPGLVLPSPQQRPVQVVAAAVAPCSVPGLQAKHQHRSRRWRWGKVGPWWSEPPSSQKPVVTGTTRFPVPPLLWYLSHLSNAYSFIRVVFAMCCVTHTGYYFAQTALHTNSYCNKSLIWFKVSEAP